MKILILVLSYNDNGLYSMFLETQKQTWGSLNVDGVETYYYFGNGDDNKIIGNEIYTKIPESLMIADIKQLNVLSKFFPLTLIIFSEQIQVPMLIRTCL